MPTKMKTKKQHNQRPKARKPSSVARPRPPAPQTLALRDRAALSRLNLCQRNVLLALGAAPVPVATIPALALLPERVCRRAIARFVRLQWVERFTSAGRRSVALSPLGQEIRSRVVGSTVIAFDTPAQAIAHV